MGCSGQSPRPLLQKPAGHGRNKRTRPSMLTAPPGRKSLSLPLPLTRGHSLSKRSGPYYCKIIQPLNILLWTGEARTTPEKYSISIPRGSAFCKVKRTMARGTLLTGALALPPACTTRGSIVMIITCQTLFIRCPENSYLAIPNLSTGMALATI